MRRALLIIVFAIWGATAAKAQNNYYVSTTGSDSNAGTQASPWLTMQHAIASFTLGTSGAVIHVAAGTYTDSVANGSALSPACDWSGEWFCANRGGTSTSAQLMIQCDSSAWPTWSGGGCIAGSAALLAVFENAAYVTLKGFEYGNHPNSTNATITAAYVDGWGTVSGGGNYITITQDYFHDLAQTASSSYGEGCPSTGMVYSSYNSMGDVVSQNKLVRFGDYTKTYTAVCNQTHILYSGGNIQILDNIIAAVPGPALTDGNQDCQRVIANNVIIYSRYNAIFESGGSGQCANDGYATITNNILVNNGDTGQDGPIDYVYASTNMQTTAYIYNNLFYGNTPNSCQSCTANNTITTEAPNTTFVNYQNDGSGDYHLKAGSLAIGGGTTRGAGSLGCASACAPTVDFASAAVNSPPDIGAYAYGTSAALPLAPTALIVSVK